MFCAGPSIICIVFTISPESYRGLPDMPAISVLFTCCYNQPDAGRQTVADDRPVAMLFYASCGEGGQREGAVLHG